MMYVLFCCRDVCLMFTGNRKGDTSVTVYNYTTLQDSPHATWDQKVVNARPSDMRLCSLTSVSHFLNSQRTSERMQGQEHSILACQVPFHARLRMSLVLRRKLELLLAVGFKCLCF